MSEKVTCGACGKSFHSEEEKADHIKKVHKMPMKEMPND
jgi:hypothetical protein